MKKLPNINLRQALPPPIGDFSLNVCRNPDCDNYGAHPDYDLPHGRSLERQALKAASNSKQAPLGAYKLVGHQDSKRVSTGPKSSIQWKDARLLTCAVCETNTTVLSNAAFDEEFRRILFMPRTLAPGPVCPECGANYVNDMRHFRIKSRNGPGFRMEHNCGEGRKSRFTYTPSYRRQRIRDQNIEILNALINGSGFNDIMRIARSSRGGKLGAKRLYERIFWLEKQLLSYEQAQLQDWKRSTALSANAKGHHRIAHDTVDIGVNWETAEDRRNTIVKCHASADADSGYVYRLDVSFDGDIDPVKYLREHVVPGSGSRLSRVYTQKSGRSFRHPLLAFQRPTARFHEPLLYASALHQIAIFRDTEAPLIADVNERERLKAWADKSYRRIEKIYRNYYDMNLMERDHRSPFDGAVVSSEYSHAAHIAAVREMLQPGRFTIYTDASSNLVRSMALIFRQEIELDKFEWVATYMTTRRLPKTKRQELVGEYRARFREWCREYQPIGTFEDKRRQFVAAHMHRAVSPNSAFEGSAFQGSMWFKSPISTFYEPSLVVGLLIPPRSLRRAFAAKKGHRETDTQGHVLKKEEIKNEVADRIVTASLQAVDTFFNSLRERVSATGRTATGGGSMSGTYIRGNVFNPRVLTALLNIYRVCYNYFELRPFERDNASEDWEVRGTTTKRIKVPGTDEIIEVTKQKKKSPIKLSPAMRHGIHHVPKSGTPKAPDQLTVLYSPWEVYGTPLFEKLRGLPK